jgi:hypothetical protein
MILRLIPIVVLAALAASTGAAAPPATPPCPQVEGWTFARTFGPIDTGGGVDFSCEYVQGGKAEILTLNPLWLKPSVRDTDADYSQCARASSRGASEGFIWSKSHFTRVHYTVSGGTTASNAAVFQANRERIEKAVLVLLAASESLAKPCAKTPPASPARDTQRPTVRVRPAKGTAGAVVTFSFSVADNSGRVGVLLTIYDAPAKSKRLFRKNYGSAKSGSYTLKIRIDGARTDLWCITATDGARNAATACSSLVVR